MSFQEAFAEIVNIAQKLGMRNLNVYWMRERLNEKGFNGCIICQNPIKPRGVYGHKDGKFFCSDKCETDYYRKYWWTFFRDSYLHDHDKCEICGKNLAIEVHHKLPIRLHPIIGQGEIWNKNNLIALCHQCHIAEHKRLRKTIRIKEFRHKIKTEPLTNYLDIAVYGSKAK